MSILFNHIQTTIAVIILVGCMACNPERVDTRRVSQEIKDRKVRKVTDAQIMEETEKRVAPQLLRLQTLMDTTRCNPASPALYDSLVYVWEAQIGLFAGNALPVTEGSDKEKMSSVADAYLYCLENDLPLTANIQLTPERIIYTLPYTGPGCADTTEIPKIWLVNLAKKNIVREIK